MAAINRYFPRAPVGPSYLDTMRQRELIKGERQRRELLGRRAPLEEDLLEERVSQLRRSSEMAEAQERRLRDQENRLREAQEAQMDALEKGRDAEYLHGRTLEMQNADPSRWGDMFDELAREYSAKGDRRRSSMFARMALADQRAQATAIAGALEKGYQIHGFDRPIPSMSTEDIKEYNLAMEQGYGGTFTDWMDRYRSSNTSEGNLALSRERFDFQRETERKAGQAARFKEIAENEGRGYKSFRQLEEAYREAIKNADNPKKKIFDKPGWGKLTVEQIIADYEYVMGEEAGSIVEYEGIKYRMIPIE